MQFKIRGKKSATWISFFYADPYVQKGTLQFEQEMPVCSFVSQPAQLLRVRIASFSPVLLLRHQYFVVQYTGFLDCNSNKANSSNIRRLSL